MNRIRFLGLLVAVGAAAALTGCVAPGGYYSDGGYGYGQPYGQPYYAEPAPVVVAPPISVGVGVGGYYGGGPAYYDRRGNYDQRGNYDRRAYARPDYPAQRPGNAGPQARPNNNPGYGRPAYAPQPGQRPANDPRNYPGQRGGNPNPNNNDTDWTHNIGVH